MSPLQIKTKRTVLPISLQFIVTDFLFRDYGKRSLSLGRQGSITLIVPLGDFTYNRSKGEARTRKLDVIHLSSIINLQFNMSTNALIC